MHWSIFSAIGILIYLVSLFIARKKRFLILQVIIIAALLLAWVGVTQLQAFLSSRIIFEELGLVQSLVLQIMDRLFFNIVGPVIALAVSIFKKGTKLA